MLFSIWWIVKTPTTVRGALGSPSPIKSSCNHKQHIILQLTIHRSISIIFILFLHTCIPLPHQEYSNLKSPTYTNKNSTQSKSGFCRLAVAATNPKLRQSPTISNPFFNVVLFLFTTQLSLVSMLNYWVRNPSLVASIFNSISYFSLELFSGPW